MDLPTLAAGIQLTRETLASLSPYFGSESKNAAIDTWMATRGNARLEKLVHENELLKSHIENLQEKLTENEKFSPSSGYTKVLYEYVTSPIEEKVELLRNALLNGLYGDYTIGQRQDFYRMIQDLQPIDVFILKHLTSTCPRFDFHKDSTNLYRIFEERGLHEPTTIKDKTLNKANEKSIPTTDMEASLDRLRSNGLTINPISMMDIQNPYQGCVATNRAHNLLQFITDPQKVLTHDTATV